MARLECDHRRTRKRTVGYKHTDWLRDYDSALNTLGTDLKPK